MKWPRLIRNAFKALNDTVRRIAFERTSARLARPVS